MSLRVLACAAFWIIATQCNAIHCSAQELTAQAASVSSAPSSGYRLGPGDEIRLSVFNEPDLSAQQRLGANGEISVPLVGDMNARGMSPEDLSRAIETRLRDGYLRNPRVSVSVVTYRPFFVIGEVNNPGSFPYSPNLSVTSAIATAGGFSRRAARGQVYVKHEGELEEHAYTLSANIPLGPGDTVRVGQSFLASLSDLPLGLIPH